MAKKGLVPTIIFIVIGLAFCGVFLASTTLVAHAADNSSLAISDEATSVLQAPPSTGGGSTTTPSSQISLAISEEISTKTLTSGSGSSTPSIAISDEISTTTKSSGGGCTSNCGSSGAIAISDEISAQTTGGGSGGCTSNCGSSSGGGGCIANCGSTGGSTGYVTTPVPTSCPLYLTKYIRYGYNNDPWEVLKLQVFLRTFEGFSNVPTSGFYDKTTEQAVRVFQVRYGHDVLTPWGLGTMESTGYVFITTTYTINQIYCNRTTANNFDLRHFYPTSGSSLAGSKEGNSLNNFDHGFIASSTASSTLGFFGRVASSTKGLFQAGAAGLVSFITEHPGVWLTILLLLALLVLLYLIWKLRDEDAAPIYDYGPNPTTSDLHDPMLPLVVEDKTVLPDEELIIDDSEEVNYDSDLGPVPPDLPVENGSKDNK